MNLYLYIIFIYFSIHIIKAVEDLVHPAVQAVAAAVHDPVAAVHQAAHVAHAVEASPVEDAPNQSRQRAAAARSQSKYFPYDIFLLLFFFPPQMIANLHNMSCF